MNDLMAMKELTMDSREIAELTNKMHGHVCRDIQEMLTHIHGGNQSKFGSVYLAGNGETRNCYKLPYRETMILVSGYSFELRARVIDRWLELEKKDRPSLPDFTDPVAAARAWADEAEAKRKAENALALAAPKVESFDALQRSEKTMSITHAAKHFGMHPKTEVFPYLRAMCYLTVRDLPTQSAIDAGYLALREAECGDGEFRPQSVVLTCQLETWRTRVVPQIKAWISRE